MTGRLLTVLYIHIIVTVCQTGYRPVIDRINKRPSTLWDNSKHCHVFIKYKPHAQILQ